MVGRAAPAQLVHDRLVDAPRERLGVLGVDAGHRRVAAHAAGVRALVAVADALVVLGRAPSARRARRRTRASSESSSPSRNSSSTTSVSPKRCSVKNTSTASRASRLVGGDDHALARGQRVGLQHRRVGGAGQVARRLLAIAEHRVPGGGHAAVAHQLLGVALRALEPRGRGAAGRTRAMPAPRARPPARHQRRLGADHHQVDPPRAPRARARPRPPPPRRGTPRRRARCRRCRARQARSGFCGLRSERAHERVLAAPAADDEDARRPAPRARR